MKGVVGHLLLATLAIGAGAAAFAFLAQAQVGSEADVLRAHLNLGVGGGGLSGLVGVLEKVDPGVTDRMTQAAVITAVGGAFAAVAVYALGCEVLS